MKITITEAENILSRVFSNEIGPGKVEIESDPNANIRHTSEDFYITKTTMDRILKAMGRQGLKIEAIRSYREIVAGVGLADAKNYIEKLAAQP